MPRIVWCCNFVHTVGKIYDYGWILKNPQIQSTYLYSITRCINGHKHSTSWTTQLLVLKSSRSSSCIVHVVRFWTVQFSWRETFCTVEFNSYLMLRFCKVSKLQDYYIVCVSMFLKSSKLFVSILPQTLWLMRTLCTPSAACALIVRLRISDDSRPHWGRCCEGKLHFSLLVLGVAKSIYVGLGIACRNKSFYKSANTWTEQTVL